MNNERIDVRAIVIKWKYPLLVLLAGVLLMLLPNADKPEPAAPDAQEALAAVLSKTQGVGEARVLISDSGVVVACTGAANAEVRLDILRAVRSYTGFGSDKITILKMRK